MQLHNKIAVVTGGAMGIGLATVKRLVAGGCSVAVIDLNEQALDAVKKLFPSGKVSCYPADITNKQQVYSIAKEILTRFSKVDILVNNAGVVFGGDITDTSDEVWEKTIAVNLTALVYTIKAFLPGMYERNEGCVVNVSSASATLGVGGLSVYSATKWAVWGLTESLRFEARNKNKKGVTFHSVHPSYIATGLFEGAKLGILGNLIAPLIEDHDVIARAIVNDLIVKGKNKVMRPITVNLVPIMRAIMPDKLFQLVLSILGIPQSMNHWKGRG